jgi:glutathione synthase/RimK-type ligase-like ATP-grasp enzyme
VRFNTEDYPARCSIVWRRDECTLIIGGASVVLSELRSIWYRRPVAPTVEGLEPGSQREQWASFESSETLRGAWRCFDGLWVNHPDRDVQAGSKLEQLRRASSIGFSVPSTLVSNHGEAISEFAARHPGGVVCKPVGSGRVELDGVERLFFTSLVGPEVMSRFPTAGGEPYMFQELVEKDYELRITVIGNTAYAARIDSQTAEESRIDWRRADQRLVPVTWVSVSDDLAERCLSLVHAYGLEFGAIDLAVTPGGEVVFFEINPSGQWAWLEHAAGLPLRSALADLLEFGQVRSHGGEKS